MTDRNLNLASYLHMKCCVSLKKTVTALYCNVLSRTFGTKSEFAGKWIKLQVKNLVNFSLNR
jgi:hypothetical protein